MKEIKFRAWNGEALSEPFYPWQLIPDNTGGLMDMNGFSVMWIGSGWEWIRYICHKDKNGKEIYEKYIIKDSDGDEFVIWYDDYFLGYVLHSVKDINRVYDFTADFDKNIEIVGHIFDRPELLKKMKEFFKR